MSSGVSGSGSFGQKRTLEQFPGCSIPPGGYPFKKSNVIAVPFQRVEMFSCRSIDTRHQARRLSPELRLAQRPQ
jgi:hypothetical protein